MHQIEQLSDETYFGRDLYMLDINTADEFHGLTNFSAKYFVCLLVWDSDVISREEVDRVAQILLDSGCVYYCIWGLGCSRAHDIIDDVIVDKVMAFGMDGLIMTTWHEEEDPDEALWYFLNVTIPDDPYSDDCSASLVISIGSGQDLLDRIRYALRSPLSFSDEVLDEFNDEATQQPIASEYSVWHSFGLRQLCARFVHWLTKR